MKNEKLILKKLESVVNFFSNYRCNSISEDFFKCLDSFLRHHLNADPLLVFALEKDVENFRLDEMQGLRDRIYWNPMAFSRNYSLEELSSFFKILCNNSNSKPWEYSQKIGENLYCSCYIGGEHNRHYVAIFKLQKENQLEEIVFNSLASFIKNTFITILQLKSMAQENALIHIDDVTGLFNQRRLQKDLRYFISKCDEESRGFIVLFIDIDHFKNVNDGHGHLVGTRLLAEMGKILKTVLRESDLVYRYGGDEFVMIVHHEIVEDIKGIGERILQAVKENKFNVSDGEETKLSVSIGIARYPIDASTSQDILAIADQMMYHAKAAGRGRVCFAHEYFQKD